MSEIEAPARGEYLIRGGTVLSMDPRHRDPRARRRARPRRVDRRGRSEPGGIDAPGAEVIPAEGMIVMPGLIETHFHMWSSLGRNFVAEGFEYFPAKWATSAHYEPDDFYASVLLGLVECLNAGITTVHDWDHNTRTPGPCRRRAARPIATASCARATRTATATCSRSTRRWTSPTSTASATSGSARRSPFEGARPPRRQPARARTSARWPCSTSRCARRSTAACRSRSTRSRAARPQVSAPVLEERGYLGPDFLIAHFLAATQADREAMARAGTPLSYAVHSELRLGDAGDARAALLRMLDAGVTVSLSIDATSIAPGEPLRGDERGLEPRASRGWARTRPTCPR